MKLLSYQKKERGSMLGVCEVEVMMDYGTGPLPMMIRLKHFRSKKGNEFIAFPSEKIWDSEEKQYEDVVKFTLEGANFPFSNAVLELIKKMPPQEEAEETEFPF